MGAVITVQAVPAGSAIGGAVGGRCRRVGGPGGGEAGRGVIGDGILECYESLGLHYGHVFVGGGGRRSGGHNLCSNC